MSEPSRYEHEGWVVERGGEVVEKKAAMGAESLSRFEKMVYCLWVADYGMRNAGDLDTASDLYPDFQREGAKLAKELGFVKTAEAFGLSKEQLQKDYFERFSGICDELKGGL